jgi:DNA-binding NarL/FixJ family response regulator
MIMPSPAAAIRVLILDDHELITESLALLLSRIPGIEVVGTCTDSRAVLPFLDHTPVDVLISDVHLPHLTGIDLARLVRAQHAAVRVLMVSVSEEAETIREAFRAGVSGYVMKRANKAELERALRTVAGGETYYSESVLARLVAMPMEQLKQDVPTLPPSTLTDREIEIVRLLSEELSTNGIADKLFISPATVETHRHNILRKLGAKNAIGIVKYAIRYGLI